MGEQREIEGRLVARDTRAMGETRAVLAWDNGRGRSVRVGVVAEGGAAEALGRLVIGRPVRFECEGRATVCARLVCAAQESESGAVTVDATGLVASAPDRPVPYVGAV